MLPGGIEMPTHKLNILIVEDDVQLRLLLSAILTQSGYKVRTAGDGFAALAEMRIEMPDILLSDLYMAGMSGFELLSVVRRRFPAMRVVAMSSAFAGADVPEGISADAFYTKATGVFSLLQIISTIIGQDPLPSGARAGAVTPIWIDVPVGELYGLMSCPECLRTFAQVFGTKFRFIHETDCVYCHSLIRYAVVEPEIPAIALVGLIPAGSTSEEAKLMQ